MNLEQVECRWLRHLQLYHKQVRGANMFVPPNERFKSEGYSTATLRESSTGFYVGDIGPSRHVDNMSIVL